LLLFALAMTASTGLQSALSHSVRLRQEFYYWPRVVITPGVWIPYCERISETGRRLIAPSPPVKGAEHKEMIDRTDDKQEPARIGLTRLIAGYAAIIFILPYLALKIAWISGAPVGMIDKSLADDSTLLALNILTFCMDAVAIVLALTFTHRWGLRAPSWLALAPMWVGTGFLAPIIVEVPMTALARLLGLDFGQRPLRSQAGFEPWVFGVVFTSFVCQGLALLTAFFHYVRERWGVLLRMRAVESRPPSQAIVILGAAAFVIAATLGLLHLLGAAAGAPFGLPSALSRNRGANFYLLHATFGLAALSAAAGIGMLINRVGTWSLWLPLSLGWIGAGAMFSWGAWFVLAAALMLSRGEGAWLLMAINVIKTGAGLLIGALIGLMVAATARR
jgi:hypothetical protein